MTAPSPNLAPACRLCGSTNVQTGKQTHDGKTACRCRACGFPWAEVLS